MNIWLDFVVVEGVRMGIIQRGDRYNKKKEEEENYRTTYLDTRERKNNEQQQQGV